ncbi:MAG: hypothetical protein ABT940_05965 [Alphaproteobacteria bacterium]
MFSRRLFPPIVPLLLLVLAVLSLSGCYRTVTEIVLSGDAASLPGLAGTYQSEFNHMAEDPYEKDLLRFKPSSNGNDFLVAISDDEDSGSTRFRKLRDDIFVAQMALGPMALVADGYDIGFVRITAGNFELLLAVPPGHPLPDDSGRAAFEQWFEPVRDGSLLTASQREAAKYGVSIQNREGRVLVEGKPADVRRFIAFHRDWQFVQIARYTRIGGK